MAQRHVTVIGAGIVGVCSALHLQRQGFNVTLVDRLAPGEGTSFGNACVITDSGLVPLATPGIARSGLKMLLDRDGPVFYPSGLCRQSGSLAAAFHRSQ
jgi:D-amino-acid dehydrogenase